MAKKGILTPMDDEILYGTFEEVTGLRIVSEEKVPDDRFVLHAAFRLTAEAIRDGDTAGRVRGVALPYNTAGWFPQVERPVMVASGSATDSLLARHVSQERDILLVATHDDNRTLARVGAGTLRFEDSARSLNYSADIDLADPEGLSAYRKVDNGSWSAASVRFHVLESKNIKAVDNSPESTTGDKPVSVLLATKVDIMHVALVPQGAYTGATALAAERSQKYSRLAGTANTVPKRTTEVQRANPQNPSGRTLADLRKDVLSRR